MWEFIFGFLFGVYFWRCWTHPKTKKVKPGLNSDILLPHQQELELHHNSLSSCSQKVRACLGETGLKFRKIHHDLPSNGCWETKKEDFLRNVNPAGTVPVLIHNGHPIYESHEQIVYIDQVLMSGGPKLTPNDPVKKALMDKWVDSGAMIPTDGLEKRIGNLLNGVTQPLFCASVLQNFGIWNFIEYASMIPLVRSRVFIVLIFVFKFYGVEAFLKIKKFADKIAPTRKAINYHFNLLTKDLEATGGPYLCGEMYTLADVSMVPIFERMEYSGWWTESLKSQFPVVKKYWDTIQQRDGYIASKADMDMQQKMNRMHQQVEQWKKQYKWFNDFYEN